MPDWKACVRERLGTAGLRPDRERDVVDDIAGQLDEAYREALARGLSDADAEAAAFAHIPDWTTLAKQVAESRRLSQGVLDRAEVRAADAGARGNGPAGFAGSVLHDVRYALRLARQAPMFTAVAVLTLGLGIGANATIFSWINSILLDLIPGADNRGLVAVRGEARNGSSLAMSYPDYLDLRAATPAAASLIVHDMSAASLADGAGAERIWIELVSDNFFDVLRVPMAAGRGFQPHEGVNATPVVVISDKLAHARFGGAEAVGKTLVVNRTPLTIVGVTPAKFASGYTGLAMDAWLPVPMSSAIIPGANRATMRNNGWLDSFARLAPGLSLEQTAVQLTEAANRINLDQGRTPLKAMTVVPLWRSQNGAQGVIGPVLLVLMAMVTIVLLVACANIANLLLARAASRSREFALRLSLGCGRGRLIRQLLTESLVLVFLAAIAAAVIQRWTSGALAAMVPPSNMPIGLSSVPLSWSVILFTAGAAFVSAVAFGLAPALQAGRTDLVSHLNAGGGRLAGGRRTWLRNTLVASQIAFALLLLVSAGLFLRSLQNARLIQFGFNTERVLLASVDLFSAGYDQERGSQLLARVLDDIRALPLVESASLARRVPLGITTGSSSTTIEPEGFVAPKDDPASTYLAWVASDYFRVMRIPVVAGREFAGSDRADQPEVILVNQAFANRYWPGQNAIGRRVRFGEAWLTVAGVVANSKYRRLDERDLPFLYRSTIWSYRPDVTLHLKTTAPAEQLIEPLKAIVQRADVTLPLFNVTTLEEHVKAASFAHTLAASLLTVLGILALALASIGLYASMAYSVSRRTPEMGARLALGATPADIKRLVLRHAARVITVGVGVGLVLAIGVSQLFAPLLVGVRPFDPLTFAGVAALLTAIALAASYVPARRAARLDPLKALRYE